jgi:hypothetical protein
MNVDIIKYVDIPIYCDRIDRDKRSTVVLGKFQAWLYRHLIRNQLRRLRGAAYILDMVVYSGLLICILVCAKYLFLLAHFVRQDSSRDDLVEFKEMQDGNVAVTFNPSAEPNAVVGSVS